MSPLQDVQEALRLSEEAFRGAFETAAIGMALVSPEGRFMQVNESLCEIVGYDRELLAKSFQDITHPDDLEADLGLVGEVLADEIRSYQMEKRYFHASGQVVWVLLSVSLVRDSQGEPRFFVSQIEDITSRKAAETALRRERQLLRQSQTAAHIGSWEWDLETGEPHWSEEQFRLHGVDPADGVPPLEDYFALIHPVDRAALRASMAENLERRARFSDEYRVLHPTLGVRSLVVHGDYLAPEPENGLPARLAGTTQDMTDHRRAEDKFRGLLESAPDATVIVDERGRIALANKQAESLLGYSRDELLGETVELFVPERLRERHVGHRSGFFANAAARPMGAGLELFARHKDGREIPVEISLSPFEAEEGRFASAAIRDITERKRSQAELERSNEELEQFAYVASHDLSEPLRVIGGFVQLLQRRYEGKFDEQGDRFIEATVEGVERMQAMIDALLEYSRVGRATVGSERVDCERTVQEARSSLARLIGERGAEFDIGELPTIEGEPALIGQLFQNLISNAVKYGDPEHPRVRVAADRETGHWHFSVEDNGAGIDPQHRERVFEMFKRLHDRDTAGSGIGLAICKRIVEKHGGRIWVEPREAGGSAFQFTMPDTGGRT